MKYNDLLELARTKALDAQSILEGDEPDQDKADGLLAEAKELRERAERVKSAMTLADVPERVQPKASGLVVTKDEVDHQAEDPNLPAYKSLGEQLMDIYKAGRGGRQPSPRLLKAHKAVTGASEAVPADGGFLVQEDFTGFMSKPDLMIGGILPRVRQVRISGNADSLAWVQVDESSRATGSRWGGVRGYWLAEGDQITHSEPIFQRQRLELQKVGAMAYATDEVLQDAALLESVIGQAMREELTFLVEDAIINGTGAGQPTGILASANNARVQVAKETGQAADTIVSENVMKMFTRRWRGGSYVWLIGQDVLYELMNMDLAVGTGGQLTFMPPGGLADRPHGTLLGYPLVENEYSPALGDANDIALVDLSEYVYVTKGGVQSASSIHIRFDYDETCFRFILRCNGMPTWSDAVTPFKATGSTITPYVSLAERA